MFEHCRAFVIATNQIEARALELCAQSRWLGEVAASLTISAAGASRAAITVLFPRLPNAGRRPAGADRSGAGRAWFQALLLASHPVHRRLPA